MIPTTRTTFLGVAIVGGISSIIHPFLPWNKHTGENDHAAAAFSTPQTTTTTTSSCVYHEPPPCVKDEARRNYYSNNPSVFGRILEGSLPSRNYRETSDLLAFRDRSPRAELHALIIPKRYIPNVYSLTPEDLHLVQDMKQMGLDLLEEHTPQALATNDFILCFHIPPFNSVDHLHLHVLAPASKMNVMYRYGKYKCGARWCTCVTEVITRLQEGLAAVPYPQMIFF